MIRHVLGVAVGSALLLTACGGGSSPPQRSAARACSDFTAWYQAHRSDIASGVHSAALKRAVAEAPSGKLDQAMNKFRSDLHVVAETFGPLQTAVKKLEASLAASIVTECRSVKGS